MTLSAPIFLLLVPLVGWYAWRVWKASFVDPRRAMLGTRIALFALLAMALARPEVSLPTRNVGVLALVDDSVSMLPSRRAAVKAALGQLAATHPDLRVWRFGADVAKATVAEPFGPKPQTETRLERALFAAEGAFGDAGARRIVLFSDGRETSGDARRAARALGAEKIQIMPVRLPAATDPEVAIVDVHAPDAARKGEQTEVRIVVRSTLAQKARITLTEGGRPVWEDNVQLKAGDNDLPASMAFESSGRVELRAEVQAEQDTIKDNNFREQTLYVAGPPRVLFGLSQLDQASALADALTLQGIDVVRFDPPGAPQSIDELAGFDAIVLDELVPARLDEFTQSLIESYVRDLGGGLLFVTGQVGLGTLDRNSPIQRVLPLGSEDRVENQVPPVAMVMVVDRSGSMEGDKLAWTKRAALGTLDALPPDAQVGLVAFDAEFRWIAPLNVVSNRQVLTDEINSLSAGGGTRFYPALEDVFFQLGQSKAAVKHIVLLTDGLSTDGVDFKPLAQKMAAAGITCTTVAISRDADLPLLREIAKISGGRSFVTDSAAEVKRIFADESRLQTKRAQIDHPFTPTLSGYFAPLARLDLSSMPQLLGYVATTLRPGAQQVMTAENKQPLLGVWRYGLGQAAVFASDVDGTWAREWVKWPEYPRVWSGVLRQLMRDRTSSALTIDGKVIDGSLEVVADLDEAHAKNAKNLEVDVYATDSATVSHRIEMTRTGPGQLRGRAPWSSDGSIVLNAKALDGSVLLGAAVRVVDQPITPELVLGDDDALLNTIAQLSGGEVVSVANLTQASTSSAQHRVPLAPWLLGLALLMFLVDLFVKRVRPTAPRA
ncbi:MAG: VWA domain-containing protein [Polyangia bacterium]